MRSRALEVWLRTTAGRRTAALVAAVGTGLVLLLSWQAVLVGACIALAALSVTRSRDWAWALGGVAGAAVMTGLLFSTSPPFAEAAPTITALARGAALA